MVHFKVMEWTKAFVSLLSLRYTWQYCESAASISIIFFLSSLQFTVHGDREKKVYSTQFCGSSQFLHNTNINKGIVCAVTNTYWLYVQSQTHTDRNTEETLFYFVVKRQYFNILIILYNCEFIRFSLRTYTGLLINL
jgi:hypothetical protein